MKPEETLIAAEVTKAVAKDVYQDALHPAVQEVGKDLHTISKLITIALTPISAMVWGYDKIKQYVSESLECKLSKIPPENIVTPKMEIAGPVLETLRYTGHDSDLRELYSNLLATSMDLNTAKLAHPSFVEILKQLCPDEAKILQLFNTIIPFPIISIRAADSNGHYSTPLTNFNTLAYKANCSFPELTCNYIENLNRLGLCKITYDQYVTDEGVYDPLEKHPTVLQLISFIKTVPGKQVEVKRGAIDITAFGHQFYDACVSTKI